MITEHGLGIPLPVIVLPAAGFIKAAAVIGLGATGVVSPDERLPVAEAARKGLTILKY